MIGNIEQKLKENALAVEELLCEYIPVRDVSFSVIHDAMRYSLLAGGKRLRPFLTAEFAALAARSRGGDPGLAIKAAMPYACAVEMIHTYSLIHDDLPCMDNDTLRRGKPTCHIKFGEANALLAGDALLTHAFGTAVSNPHASPEANCRAAALLSECAGADGMIGGQVLDLIGEEKAYGMDELCLLQSLKTGELIRCASLLGCIAGGADEELISAAEEYSMGIGRAFQIIDDILDVIGDEALLGKPVGSDKKECKTTFATYMTVDEAYALAGELTEKAKRSVSEVPGSENLILLADYLLTRNK